MFARARDEAPISDAAPTAPAITAPPPPLTLTPAQEKNRIIAGIAITANTNTTSSCTINNPLVILGNSYSFVNNSPISASGLKPAGGISGGAAGVTTMTFDGVNFSGVPIEVKYILIGAIIVVNTALSQWQRRQGE